MKVSKNIFHKAEFRIFLWVALCVFFFLVHIGVRTCVVTQGYEISVERKEIAKLESQVAELKAKKSRQRSSASLEKLVEALSVRGIKFHSPKAEQLMFIHGLEDD